MPSSSPKALGRPSLTKLKREEEIEPESNCSNLLGPFPPTPLPCPVSLCWD